MQGLGLELGTSLGLSRGKCHGKKKKKDPKIKRHHASSFDYQTTKTMDFKRLEFPKRTHARRKGLAPWYQP